MTYTTLISVAQLQQLQTSDQPFMVFDCSFDLTTPDAGRAMYLDSRIPGAVYAHLDEALSDKTPPMPGQPDTRPSGGRHPLPSREQFAAWLGSVGFNNTMQAVVYDRQGANYCGRLWWMLKWVGHANVAVLDGGLQAWKLDAANVAATGTVATLPASNYALVPAIAQLFATNTVVNNLGRPVQTILDARAAPRFRGEMEPLDPVAGHIPGALNRPFAENIGPDGRFKPAAQLRTEFEAVLAGRDPTTVVHHCGSGVSALPNLIAMVLAGMGHTGLYAGSWSEWCSDSTRPFARG